MAVKTYRPTTPSRRYMTNTDFGVLTKKEPEKSLCRIIKKNAGRNNKGKITVRHRGGGAKRMYRLVDLKNDKFDVVGEVMALEYDPNRTAFIVLVKYSDGEKRYLLAPTGVKVGDKVLSSQGLVEAKNGNRMPLQFVPEGSLVFNVELVPGLGGKMVRSAGNAATLMIKEGDFAQLRLPSGEIRLVSQKCAATIGQVSNLDHSNIVIGKAGRKRHMRRRPEVRGKAMNPCDHPHGGGEGRNPIGLIHPKTPTGKPALGVRTRKKNKKSTRYILRRRTKN